MKVGKLDSELLRNIVFEHIKNHREEVIVRPGIGEDCAVLDFGEYACVLSTDPITGAANEVGRLAVHISCNDIASNGVEPLGLMLTIMAPEGTTAEEIEQIMRQAGEEAEKLNVEIIGGHTEITSAVNKVIVSSTAIGRQFKEKVVQSKANPGDIIIMTKNVGLEGTSIIAHDFEEKLIKDLGKDIVYNAKKMMEDMSVITEGVVAGQVGVTSMHDITEGGLLGAIWELCEASNVGAVIFKNKVNIAHETEEICKYFKIDPFKLISSGCMIMTVSKEKENILLESLKEKGVKAAAIGEITEKGKYLVDGIEKIEITPPESDELYKVM
ncbi:AIR synthase [Crassaminicella thermophila]|uniref:AIR synthase n=1 Tax=Crassaminicella thermophila TaxID=2599308 RepID=A0A5C0SG94_CRATE|nr:AIR synthase family protein [Crassaminicella thermophila]QEK12962.1 AIR synthase [Crassaminicella thermophila]